VNSKRLSISDLTLAAFLLVRQIQPTIEVIRGRVVFVYEISDDLYKGMNDYNNGAQAPAVDLFSAYRELRTKMNAGKIQCLGPAGPGGVR